MGSPLPLARIWSEMAVGLPSRMMTMMPAPSSPITSMARCNWPARSPFSANISVNMDWVWTRTSVGLPGSIRPFCSTICSPYSAVLA